MQIIEPPAGRPKSWPIPSLAQRLCKAPIGGGAGVAGKACDGGAQEHLHDPSNASVVREVFKKAKGSIRNAERAGIGLRRLTTSSSVMLGLDPSIHDAVRVDAIA